MLALIAGTGALPGAITARVNAPLICALQGFEPAIAPDLTFRIEQLGSFLTELRARDVTEVCFAGAVRRPTIDPSAIDTATVPLVPVLQAALGQGDDGTLRAVIGIFEDAGFEVRGAHEVAPDLLPSAGVLSKAKPNAAQMADATRAQTIQRAMAAVDIGQACVVRDGQAVAIEATQGTDWMLRSICESATADSVFGDPLSWVIDGAAEVIAEWTAWFAGRDEDSPEKTRATSGVLFKAPKPGQDRRVDLPVIGPATVMLAAQAGLSAIVIEMGGVMVLDRNAVCEIADAMGMVIWVRPATDL